MKTIKNTLLTLGLAASTALFFAGCSEGDHAGHDHDGHDHGTEEAAHDGEHGSESKTASVATEVAGKVAETVAAIKVIENPTAEQIAAAKPYTLKTCVMSGEELGSMGDPIVLVVGDQQFKLCCDGCIDDLKADPAKALAKLSE
jgi:hypothetical protein